MQSPDALPTTWQRLLALSGVAFGVLFVVGWFASGGDAPDYAAADQEWTTWAEDNKWRSRVGAFAMLLAGFVFLHFVGTIRSVLGSAETTGRGSAQLARRALEWCFRGRRHAQLLSISASASAVEDPGDRAEWRRLPVPRGSARRDGM
jgi:hypothetical protein